MDEPRGEEWRIGEKHSPVSRPRAHQRPFYLHVSRNRYAFILIYAAVCTGSVQAHGSALSHGRNHNLKCLLML